MHSCREIPQTRLTVRLTPRAANNAVIRYDDGILHLRLTTPPVEGAANAACCAYVADLLGLRSSQVIVCRGHKSRDKVLRIEGFEAEALREKLQSVVPFS